MLRKLLFTMLVCAVALAAGAQELLRFNRSSYDGWTYTRSGYILGSQMIGNDEVNLFVDSDNRYTLLSPLVTNCNTADINVSFTGKTKTIANSKFDLSKTSVLVEVLSADGTVAATASHKFTVKQITQTFAVTLTVRDLREDGFRLRFSCPDADLNSPVSVNKIIVEQNALVADVNQDGSVNAADVTALYNYILNGDNTFLATSDVNGDTSVNAGDVTAVYNVILGL